MIEAITLVSILAFGWVILGASGLRGWPLIPLGFLTGAFAVVVVTTALATLGLPTRAAVVMSVLLGVGTVVALLRSDEVVSSFSRWFVVGAFGLGTVVAVARSVHLVSYHIDSYRYLVLSGLLAIDEFPAAEMNLLTKRMMSAPALHALADLGGEAYLPSFTPLLAISILGLVVWALTSEDRIARGGLPVSRMGAVLAALACLLLVTTNRFVWNAFYLNDHLFFAAALVAVAAGSWLLLMREQEERIDLLAMVALGTAALVVTRPEGFIIALLAIVPLLARLETPWYREAVLATYGLAAAGYYGYLHAQVGSVVLDIAGPLAVGIAALLVVPLLRQPIFRILRGPLPYVAELGLWALLAVFVRRDPEMLERSLRATWENAVRGAGGWGSSLVMIAVLTGVALLVAQDRNLLALRFPVTTFAPVAFILPYLSEGAYRVGPGDSLNRMLIQVVPVAVLFIVAAAQAAMRPVMHEPIAGGTEGLERTLASPAAGADDARAEGLQT